MLVKEEEYETSHVTTVMGTVHVYPLLVTMVTINVYILFCLQL